MVDDGGVEAVEIDACGDFAVVSKSFRNHRKRNAFDFGGRCPAVAGHIKGKREVKSDHHGYAFQIVVDVVADVTVGIPFVGTGITDNGQKVLARVFGIFVEGLLHFLSPCYKESLTGLLTAIGDVTVPEIGFL